MLPYRNTKNTQVACETSQCIWQYARTPGVLGHRGSPGFKGVCWSAGAPKLNTLSAVMEVGSMSYIMDVACQQVIDIINLWHFITFVDLDAMISGGFEKQTFFSG